MQNHARRGPRAATTAVATPAQAEVLAHLQSGGEPLTSAELAAALGQHPNTVREHLEALTAQGLVERTRRPASGRGRPAFRYAATRPPATRTQDLLIEALMVRLTELGDDPQALGRQAGRQTAQLLGAGSDTGPAAGLAEAMARLGFDPQPDRRGRTIRLRACPLIELASRSTLVCGFHSGLAHGLAESGGLPPDRVRLEPFAAPDACLLHLDPAPA